jgi:hypothetical protein
VDEVGTALSHIIGRTPQSVEPRQDRIETRPSEKDPDRLIPVDANIKVWRYMEFAKYLHLLHTSSLFFARADHLADRYEGSLSKPDKEDFQKDFQARAQSTTGRPQDLAERMFEDFTRHIQYLPQDTFLCCWHAGRCESAAMWKIYGESRRSVAIQSTFLKLHRTLEGKAVLGMVQYIDYEAESMRAGKQIGAVPFLFKRRSFEYEHELRCIMQRHRPELFDPQYKRDDSEAGREVAVPLDEMIERVLISPESDAWFSRLVKELTNRLGFHFSVEPSGLGAGPLF